MMTAAAIVVYMIGLLIFYVWGVFNTGWYEYYYLWDKGKDFIMFIVLYQPENRKMKAAILPVVIFSIIRFLWQLISSVTGLDINIPIITDYLFILLASVCSYLMLKELIKWHKSNGH